MSTVHIQNKSIYHFLWSVIKPYKLCYLLMIMAPILGSFYDFANQYALKLLVDAFSGSQTPEYSALLKPIVIFIGAQIWIDVVWRIGDVAEWRSEPYVRQAILQQTYDYVQHHDYQFFQNTHAGSITSKIKGVLDGYDNFWASLHHDFSSRIANTITLTFVLCVVSVKIFAFVAAWAVIFFFIMYRLSKRMDHLSFINSNHRHDIFGLVADNISNIFTLFSFASRKRESTHLEDQFVKTYIPSNIKLYKFAFLLNIVGALSYWVMLIALFFFMIHLRILGAVSNGDMVFVIGITLKMSMDLWFMIGKMQDFMRNLGDFKSAFTLLQIPQNTTDAQQPALNIKNASIAFKDLDFSYPGAAPIFNNLSLLVKAGEKIGIVGSSGAGKSSLVSLLLKYFSPSSGQILIDEQDIYKINTDSLRTQISLIPQDIMLFHRTILENIRYGNPHASDQEVFEAARLANLHHFVLSLPEQYQTLVGERGVKLSGGQRQRIAIARAILKNAPILILDEATSSLDTETEQLIQNSLNMLLENQKITVLAIAHRLSTLKHMDRIIVLDKGRIIEEGTHDQLILQPQSLYKKLWDLQQI
ncbi:MAG: ABC transporter ATP-binding protein [Gammaproteobacteria bacterium]